MIVRRGTSARIWSRQRKELTDRFPDIAAAAARQLNDGAVVDGELVIFLDGRLSFDALQRRLVTAPAKARQLVASTPASYVAFDLLAYGGVDLRTQRWTVRRARLDVLTQEVVDVGRDLRVGWELSDGFPLGPRRSLCPTLMPG
ncbi:hypothetical protein ACQPXM_06425 [Kribbella sp. CA-253562]|uniref:ATP-dependent DNA ligase n=1 Tax=Kribbella sp. CA-253562 TaxID=3239942 RepID=UPI003D8CC296